MNTIKKIGIQKGSGTPTMYSVNSDLSKILGNNVANIKPDTNYKYNMVIYTERELQKITLEIPYINAIDNNQEVYLFLINGTDVDLDITIPGPISNTQQEFHFGGIIKSNMFTIEAGKTVEVSILTIDEGEGNNKKHYFVRAA